MGIKHYQYFLLLFILIGTSTLSAQTLSAFVLDSVSKEPIPYVTILLNNKGVITNEDGNFSFIIDEAIQESDSLFISCIGYESVAKKLAEFKTNQILLSPKAIELKEVIVSNKNYTADEIMDFVQDNLEKNYSFNFTKKRLFYRNSSFNRMTKSDFIIKESTIDAFNQQFIDSVPVAQVIKKRGISILPIRKRIVTLGMQGKKDYQEKLFNNFQLSNRVPETNFYRRLKGVLDLVSRADQKKAP